MKNLLRSLLLVIALLAPAARAASPFEVQAVSSSPAFDHTQDYSSFPDLVSDVIQNQGNFSALASSNSFFAAIKFLGVANALNVNFTDTGSPGPTAVSVTLSSPGVGNVVNQSFSGPDRPNVEQQIKDYFLKDGSAQVGNFLAAIAKQSAIAVTDGNPNSSTAQQSNSTFFAQGFTPSADLPFDTASAAASDAAADGASGGSRFYGYGIGFNSGQFKAGGIKGEVSDLSLPFGYRFTDRVSIAGALGVNYVTIDDAKIYGVGLTLGVPIRVEIMNKTNPWNWRLTPLLGISARGSEDLAGGGVIWMGGLTNTVDYRVNSKLILGMVNQLTTHQSMAVKYGSTKFDPQIDQQILKNGIRAVTPLNSRLIGDVFVIQTNFLQDAAVESFTTFGGSLSFRLTPKFNVTLGGNFDTGDNYESWSVGLSSAWRF
jgi:hypothetical protein